MDDLQWADELSVALCHYLVRAAEATGEPLALAPGRPSPNESSLSASLGQVLPPERLTRLELGPLPRDEALELTKAHTDFEVAVAEIDASLRELVVGAADDGGELVESTHSGAERDEITAALAGRGAKIVFVGGNEKQAQYHAAIEADLQALYGNGIEIHWFEGWGSSWNATERAAHSRMANADAVVVMKMVRTLLGASVRRRAGELGLPWVSCQSTGRQSLIASLEQALLVVARGAGAG